MGQVTRGRMLRGKESGAMATKIPTARSAAQVFMLVGLVCVCASDSWAASSRLRICTSPSVVLQTETVLTHERTAQSLPAHERFEFSRRDRAVGVVRTLPLEAQRQWPEAPKPTERRIIFQQWRQ